jgi:hypothetical protein
VSAKVCLRCDWTGEAEDAVCPRCGTDLFASTRRAEPEAEAEASAATVPAAPHRSRSGWIVLASVVLFAVAAFAFVQLHLGPATGVPADTGRDGYLLVAARGTGAPRLWVWDLATGTATPGPLLGAMPETMVESVSLQDTWIGLTTRTGDGGRTASVLRHLGATDRPIVVARGRFVAWSAAGGYVSVARARSLGGCRFDLEVRTWFVTIRQEQRRFSGPVCGEPVAFGRDLLVPYIALDDGGSLRIAQVGNDYLSTRLRGRSILSVSNDGDLLVQAPDGPLELWFQPSAPIRVGTPPSMLVPDEVLAWSPDGSQAYVLGSQGGLHGVYQLTVGPRPRPRRPTLVAATSAVAVTATPAADGDLYLATDGVVRHWHDGALSEIPVPPGAPTPQGPLLWVATLPYSTPEG